MTFIEIPYDVVGDYDQEEKYVTQELEAWSRKQGYPATIEYMRQCGDWQRCEHYSRNRTWRMHLGDYPVYSVEVEYTQDKTDEYKGIEVYHWKGDHPPFTMSCRQKGNLAFDGVRRNFMGSIATRGV